MSTSAIPRTLCFFFCSCQLRCVHQFPFHSREPPCFRNCNEENGCISFSSLASYSALHSEKSFRTNSRHGASCSKAILLALYHTRCCQTLKALGGLDSKVSEKLKKGIQIGLSGSLGNHLVSPRGLLSHFICSLVAVEGIVTKCSLVQPKVVRSVHWCEATKTYSQREYRDATALDLGLEGAGGRARAQTSSIYPTQDDAGNPLETEFGLSEYKNHQTVVIQEMPERAPLGQLPRSIEIVLDHDLVDQVGLSFGKLHF